MKVKKDDRFNSTYNVELYDHDDIDTFVSILDPTLPMFKNVLYNSLELLMDLTGSDLQLVLDNEV